MIVGIEALRYRSLRYVKQDLSPFQILVGPNASGKSSLLDVVGLLSDAMQSDVTEAVRARSSDVSSLIWMREGGSFELAVELDVPQARREKHKTNGYSRARYEVAIGLDANSELAVLGETLWIIDPDKAGTQATETTSPQRELFPCPPVAPKQLVFPDRKQSPAGWRKVVTKKEAGNDYFMSETTKWNSPFRLGPKKLALANLPEDEQKFPIATWVKRVLAEGVQNVFLNSEAIRRPSPPGSPKDFLPDGSNLPWVVDELKKRTPERFDRWLSHVRTALPDIQDIDTVERKEDRHRYLRVRYDTGLEAPSWVLSDGTLRMLALTVVAYAEVSDRIYLIEEPENGIHPQALEVVFQSLSSTYDSQILCASHSPVFLSLAQPEQLLCLAKDPEGATDVVRGDHHPALANWKRATDIGTLFATGVLG